MLLLRYQRQRQEDAEEGGRREVPEPDMRRKINDRDIKSESHRAATRGTLICIFVCGTLLLSLGLAILFVGLLVPEFKKDPTPWLVIGPTCIVLGILVLLLSVEIILKLMKISQASAEADTPVKKNTNTRQIWGKSEAEEVEPKGAFPHPVSVVVHPATPMQHLDVNSLPGDVIQHR